MALIGLALATTAAPASAAPSLALDPTFGNGGKLTFSGAPGSGDTRLFDTVAGPDGSTVSVGLFDGTGNDSDLFFAKRNPDGSPAWTKTLPVNLIAGGDEALHSVTWSGGVITGIGDVQAASGRDLVVAQVDEQGNTTAFGGGDGVFTQSFGVFDSFRGGVRIASGDIAVGGAESADAINGNAVLALVKSDGSGLNTGFGNLGAVDTSLGTSRIDSWNDLAVEGNNIVTGGGADQNSADGNAIFGKFDATDGDTTPFGTVNVSTAGMDTVNGVVVQPDGTVVGAGSRLDTGPLVPTLFARASNGGPQNGFDGDGMKDVPLTDQNFGAFTDLQLLPSGELLPAGWAFQDASAVSADSGVAVVAPDGAVTAKATHDVGGANDFLEAVTLADRFAILAGRSDVGGDDQASMAKVSLADNNGFPPPPTDGGGGTNAPQAPAKADLVVSKVPSHRAMGVGQGDTFFLVAVANRGPDTARNVRVTDALPAGFEGVAVTTHGQEPGRFGLVPLPDGANCGLVEGQTAGCTVPELPPVEDSNAPAKGVRGKVTFLVRVKAIRNGRWPNTATVTSDTADPDPANNSYDADEVTVTGQPDTIARQLPDGAEGTATSFLDPPPDATGTAEVLRLSAAQAPPSIESLSRIARVEVAVLKKQSNRRRCLWLANKRLKFKASRARGGKCDRGRWLKASGTRRWRYKLARKWPKGTYTLYARAVNGAGVRETTFSKKDKNLVTFRVRR